MPWRACTRSGHNRAGPARRAGPRLLSRRRADHWGHRSAPPSARAGNRHPSARARWTAEAKVPPARCQRASSLAPGSAGALDAGLQTCMRSVVSVAVQHVNGQDLLLGCESRKVLAVAHDEGRDPCAVGGRQGTDRKMPAKPVTSPASGVPPAGPDRQTLLGMLRDVRACQPAVAVSGYRGLGCARLVRIRRWSATPGGGRRPWSRLRRVVRPCHITW